MKIAVIVLIAVLAWLAMAAIFLAGMSLGGYPLF